MDAPAEKPSTLGRNIISAPLKFARPDADTYCNEQGMGTMSATQIEIAAEAASEGAEITEAGGIVTIEWERDDETIASYTGKRISVQSEITLRICSHHGNCPCAQREIMVTTDVIEFSDGSVWAEGLDGGSGVWASDEGEEKFIEAVTEQYIDEQR
jgi:hypothetical protein